MGEDYFSKSLLRRSVDSHYDSMNITRLRGKIPLVTMLWLASVCGMVVPLKLLNITPLSIALSLRPAIRLGARNRRSDGRRGSLPINSRLTGIGSADQFRYATNSGISKMFRSWTTNNGDYALAKKSSSRPPASPTTSLALISIGV
jgi:hypothetical protein